MRSNIILSRCNSVLRFILKAKFISCFIFLQLISSNVSAGEKPDTSFDSMVGSWISIRDDRNVSFKIDSNGRVYSFAGALSGRLDVKNGVGGSNYAIYTDDGTCFYSIEFYDDAKKAKWNLVDRTGIIKCPIGNFVRATSIDEAYSDTRIRIMKIDHDRIIINRIYNYQVFVFDMPIYGIADIGSSRKTVYFSVCSITKKTCNPTQAEEKFCELHDMQSAQEPDVEDVNSTDFNNSWYWDILSGRSIRNRQSNMPVTYMSTAYCRLK